jgi:hypothetical protein
MRVIVIYTSKPVDVLDVPPDVTPLQLKQQLARLDAAGVKHAVLNFIRNEEPDDLVENVARLVHDDCAVSQPA